MFVRLFEAFQRFFKALRGAFVRSAAPEGPSVYITADGASGTTVDVTTHGLGNGAGSLFAAADIDFAQEAQRLGALAAESAAKQAAVGLPLKDRLSNEDTGAEAWLKLNAEAILERCWERARRKLQDEVYATVRRYRAGMVRLSGVLASLAASRTQLATLRAEMTRANREARQGRPEPRRSSLSPWTYGLLACGVVGVDWVANTPVFSSLLPQSAVIARAWPDVEQASEALGLWGGPYRLLARAAIWPEPSALALGAIVFLFVLSHFAGASLSSIVRRPSVAAPSESSARRRLAFVGGGVAVIGIVAILMALSMARVRVVEGTEAALSLAQAEVNAARASIDEAKAKHDPNRVVAASRQFEAAESALEERRNEHRFGQTVARLNGVIALLNLALCVTALLGAFFAAHGDEEPGVAFAVDQPGKLATECAARQTEGYRLIGEIEEALGRATMLAAEPPWRDWQGKVAQLGAHIHHFRAENARLRRLSVSDIAAFGDPVIIRFKDPTTRPAVRLPDGFAEEMTEARKRLEEACVRLGAAPEEVAAESAPRAAIAVEVTPARPDEVRDLSSAATTPTTRRNNSGLLD